MRCDRRRPADFLITPCGNELRREYTPPPPSAHFDETGSGGQDMEGRTWVFHGKERDLVSHPIAEIKIK